jgi:hypothetical protein
MEVRVPTHDELIALANQKMTEQAVKQIATEYQSNSQLAYESAAAGKWEDAGYHAREMRRLEAEAAPYVQAAQQQQQQQSQYTQAEQDLMRDYPDVIRKNWNTALAASNNLVMSKQKTDPEANLWIYRNSAEYIAGICHAVGIANSDGTESNEMHSPNEALRACQSKYGSVSLDEYNENVKRLAELKKYGLYPMSQ